MRIVAKLVMARDFWSKRLSQNDFAASHFSFSVHCNPPRSSAVLETFGDGETLRPSLTSNAAGFKSRARNHLDLEFCWSAA
jgi:hypothetical protein